MKEHSYNFYQRNIIYVLPYPQYRDTMADRIPRRQAPEFRDSDEGMISSILDDGFLRVALDDANQYGPHAMILLLGLVSTLTGLLLSLAMLF